MAGNVTLGVWVKASIISESAYWASRGRRLAIFVYQGETTWGRNRVEKAEFDPQKSCAEIRWGNPRQKIGLGWAWLAGRAIRRAFTELVPPKHRKAVWSGRAVIVSFLVFVVNTKSSG